MIAVVTGTSGFIGSRLVDALLWRGWTVRRLVRAGSRVVPEPTPIALATPATGVPVVRRGARRGFRTGETPVPEPLGTYETHLVDFADPRSLARTGALEGAHVVFHVGGVTKARTDAEFEAGNVGPTRALLDAIAACGTPPRRFVLVSSQAAAGPAESRERPVAEDDEPHPFESYGRSKLAAETVVREHPAGVPWTIVRPASVYGPGDTDFRAVFRQAVRGLGIYPGSRDAMLSIIYVDDLVDALIRAGTFPSAAGHTYFVTAEDASWRDVYRAAATAAHRSLRLELDVPGWILTAAGHVGDAVWSLTGHPSLVNAHKVALGRPRWWLCDGTRAREELGVTPRVSLLDGARRTYDWYMAHGGL
jgi:nucleoside-diphosphate-sugar epimerase